MNKFFTVLNAVVGVIAVQIWLACCIVLFLVFLNIWIMKLVELGYSPTAGDFIWCIFGLAGVYFFILSAVKNVDFAIWQTKRDL